MKFDVLTLFPEAFESFFATSLMGKALEKHLVQIRFHQIRDFSLDKHRSVDDAPYGGGEGMVMRADVLYWAWQSIPKEEGCVTILMSPQGRLLSQSGVREFLKHPQIILICGHYEGIDERFIEKCVDLEISIGDYVLTGGGELPAMVVIESVTRLAEGVVGNPKSLTEDSLEEGLLKYPQYTRPPEFEGVAVPPRSF